MLFLYKGTYRDVIYIKKWDLLPTAICGYHTCSKKTYKKISLPKKRALYVPYVPLRP